VFFFFFFILFFFYYYFKNNPSNRPLSVKEILESGLFGSVVTLIPVGSPLPPIPDLSFIHANSHHLPSSSCCVCDKKMDEKHSKIICYKGHYSCKDCFENAGNNAVKCNNSKIICGFPNCGGEYSEEIIKDNLPVSIYEKLNQISNSLLPRLNDCSKSVTISSPRSTNSSTNLPTFLPPLTNNSFSPSNINAAPILNSSVITYHRNFVLSGKKMDGDMIVDTKFFILLI
jgi:hypothetical protein